MSGLILPPELSGKGAGYNAGKNSPKTTAQQLFTALFNGQSHLQEALSGHKKSRVPGTRPKETGTGKSDNVTQVFTLLSPVQTSQLRLPVESRGLAGTQVGLMRKPGMSADNIPVLSQVNNHLASGEDLLLQQHSDARLQPALSQQQPQGLNTNAPAATRTLHNPAPAMTEKQSRSTSQASPEQQNPLVRHPAGAPVTIAVAQSSHQRPATTDAKPAHPQTTLLLTAGSETLPRDAVKLTPAAATITPDSPQWQQQLSQQILIMHHKGIQSAELRLHPQELGSLKISLVIKSDQAEMSFISGHSQVRTAIEAAMQHLKTALAENGISLGESHVGSDDSSSSMFNSSGNFGGKQQDTTGAGQHFSGQSPTSAMLLTVERTPSVTVPVGRVNLFA